VLLIESNVVAMGVDRGGEHTSVAIGEFGRLSTSSMRLAIAREGGRRMITFARLGVRSASSRPSTIM
jgi:hypothetical protein